MLAENTPINHANLAYIDTDIVRTDESESWIRLFKPDVPEDLLDWHVDGNRQIDVIQSDEQWAVQFEGSEPLILSEGLCIESPINVKHRLIKNKPKSDLIVKMTEYYY